MFQEIIELVLSYLRGMWRYRWYALVVAWLVCLGGWAYVNQMPDVYRSSAKVHVDTDSLLRPLLSGMTVEVNPKSRVELMVRTLLTRPNLEKLTRMTDLDLTAKDEEAMERLLADLRSKISLSGGGGRRGDDSNIYTISVTDQDPQQAKKIVQAALTLFVEDALGGTRQNSDQAERFLDKQIVEYEARLVAAENRLQDFKLKNMGMMPGSGGDYFGQMQAMGTNMEQTKLELRQAENRRDSLQRQINGEEPIPDTIEQASLKVSLPIDDRINTLEQQLDHLLLRFTEKHPEIIATREMVAFLKEQREEQLAEWMTSMGDDGSMRDANPVYQQLKIVLGQEEANIAALQVQLSEYEQRVEELQKLVDAALKVETELAALNRDYDVTKRNFQSLLSRRETLHVSQQVGQTNENIQFRVIEPPRAPLDPSGPNRPALMSGVLFFGAGTGLGLAFLLSQVWPTFDTRRKLMETTNIPVFGSVGMILSPSGVRRERIELLTYCSLGVCLLTVYAGLVVFQVTGLQVL